MVDAAFRGTPFHASTEARCRTTWWYSWGGYVVPDVYTDLHTELGAIRSGVSMNEMSPIPKVAVRGVDAAACVDHLITRDVTRMEVGQAWYSPWCNAEGKVVADGIVFRFDEEHFLFSGDQSINHFRSVSGSFDVIFEDVTDEHGILALQGPRSLELLEAVTGESWGDLRFSRIRPTVISGCPVSVARQGFTGELGYELWVERADGATVWEAVAETGATHGVEPAGEYAIDVARVEAGLILVSADYTGAGPDAASADVAPNPADFVTPYEIGLDHCVDLEKPGDFVGRAALVEERRRGPERRLVGLTIDAGCVVVAAGEGRAPDVSPRVRWDHLPVLIDGEAVGRVSSVTWSPSVGSLVGFALVPTPLALPGTRVEVDWSDYWGAHLGPVPAELCALPFVALNREDR